MKVMCINAKPIDGFTVDDPQPPLIEGGEYVVEVSFTGFYSGKLYYGIKGRKWIKGECGDLAERFVTLSDIDETETEVYKNLQTQTV